MGQIERYGVFALCLVIFLILGIAVWGGEGPRPQNPSGSAVVEAPRDADPTGPGRDPSSPDPNRVVEQPPQSERIPGPSTFPRDPQQSGDGNAAAITPDLAPAEARTYRIKKDDTLEAIARKELKDSRAVDKIRELNPGIESTKLQIGSVIKLPGAPAPSRRLEPVEPTPAGPGDWPKKHKVAPRETLASIAKRYYGDERQHTVLARANGVRDELKLPVGATLTIPAPATR